MLETIRGARIKVVPEQVRYIRASTETLEIYLLDTSEPDFHIYEWVALKSHQKNFTALVELFNARR